MSNLAFFLSVGLGPENATYAESGLIHFDQVISSGQNDLVRDKFAVACLPE